ncbi:virion structural protein [Achromobacter phage vB_AchrS_AchV4]|uniref:Virion structural protein n=1 Tax=Achromobacter phage vB_AchrS_AchV4 TaxID=2796514 RepID=A0A7T3PGU3_9CAUD|nr:virion structural protein [Achromobacter phage vB_AchrS_AchV4]QPZ53251.1 virion structural protein [Achromobacter phage vB_AchrS_AchV4]
MIRFMDGFDQEVPAFENGWGVESSLSRMELATSPDGDKMLDAKGLFGSNVKSYLRLRRAVPADWGDRFCIGFLVRPVRSQAPTQDNLNEIQLAQIDGNPTAGAQGLITFGMAVNGGQVFCTLNGELTAIPMEYGNVYHFVELEIDKVALVARAWLNNELVGTKPITGQETLLSYWIGFSNLDAVSTVDASIAYFNDFYESDGTTALNNLRIGKVKVVTRQPQADAVTEFSRGAGASNASQVADLTPDGDASYVYSNLAGAVDLYTNGDALPYPDAPVLAVAVSVSARKEGPEARSVAPMIQVDGSDEIGERVNLKVTSYTRGTTVFNANPNTGGAWDGPSAAGARFGQTLVV